MIPENRRSEILKLLEQRGYMSVDALAKELYISPPTVRRDLVVLEEEGSIRRTYGGASYNQPDSVVSPIELRRKEQREEKQAIGKLGASLVSNNDAIFVSCGSTCLEFACQLNPDYHLDILTNGSAVANRLGVNKNMHICMPAGEYSHYHDAIYGLDTVDMIRKRYAKFSFISCDGIDLNRGLTVNPDYDVILDQAFRANSETLVLMAVHDKFNKIFYYKALDLKDIDIIITDRYLGEDWENYCKENDIQLMYPGWDKNLRSMR